jgi:hypothetical protein
LKKEAPYGTLAELTGTLDEPMKLSSDSVKNHVELELSIHSWTTCVRQADLLVFLFPIALCIIM